MTANFQNQDQIVGRARRVRTFFRRKIYEVESGRFAEIRENRSILQQVQMADRPWQVPGSLLLQPEGPKTDALQSFYQYERQLVVARRPKICFIVKELIRQNLKVWLDNPGRAFGSKSRGSSSVDSTDAIDRERKMEHSRALR